MNESTLPKVKAEKLGRTGATLLPLEKLARKSPRGQPFEREIHDFLSTNFNGYTVASGNISGHWKDEAGNDHYGEHRQYKVALPLPETVQALEVFLANLAAELGEECIYFEMAGEAFLIYPKKTG